MSYSLYKYSFVAILLHVFNITLCMQDNNDECGMIPSFSNRTITICNETDDACFSIIYKMADVGFAGPHVIRSENMMVQKSEHITIHVLKNRNGTSQVAINAFLVNKKKKNSLSFMQSWEQIIPLTQSHVHLTDFFANNGS